MLNQAKLRAPESIRTGDQHRFELVVDEALVHRFAELSGDFNPLHVEAAYAQSIGYRSAVAHGALQTAWVSQALGMWIIGVRCLIRKIQSTFSSPLLYPAKVAIESRITSWTPQIGSGQVLVRVLNSETGETFSEHKVEAAVHQEPSVLKASTTAHVAAVSVANPSGRKLLVVTGGSSGVLRPVIAALQDSFDLILLGRQGIALKAPENSQGVRTQFLEIDLLAEENSIESRLAEALEGRSVWGILHGAALPVLKESILKIESERFLQECAISGVVPIRLADWLCAHSASEGARMVFIGSEATKPLPTLNSFPRSHLYAIGKRLLRETGRSLAQELASRKITVNLLHPGVMASGMNAGTSPATIRMWEAENPMKRLCGSSDLETALRFFLSSESSYVTGQELYLNGGRF